MEFPPRVVFAFAVIAAFVGIAVWGVAAAVRAKRLSKLQRGLGVTGIVLVMALLTAWVIFVWPAYWD
jgi:hypothetical protein